MEQVKRENIPKQMQERIAAFEDEFALRSLTHDDTGVADVWVAALENSEGKARIVTCTVKKNGGGVAFYVFSSRQGFQDLADRLARVLNAWLSWEPGHTKSRQACGAPDGEQVLTDSKP